MAAGFFCNGKRVASVPSESKSKQISHIEREAYLHRREPHKYPGQHQKVWAGSKAVVMRCAFSALAACVLLVTAVRAGPESRSQSVNIRAADGTVLKATYFAAEKRGPAVMLFHQGNRDRTSWAEVGRLLSAAGINALTLDMRGVGESGGPRHARLSPREKANVRGRLWPSDIDSAWQFLVTRRNVDQHAIGLAGAGWDGVENAVRAAGRHSRDARSLVLLSGETFLPGLRILENARDLPVLYVADDRDEYPPTIEAMELLYSLTASRAKRFMHYRAREAPWLGFEDEPGVAASGGHGTDIFQRHPDLEQKIVRWFAATLAHAPRVPDGLGSATALPFARVVDELQKPGGVAVVRRWLATARSRDPRAELWPEIVVGIFANDRMRAGEAKMALEVMKLNLEAYPGSADANTDLASAYLMRGDRDLARMYAERALAILNSNGGRAASWSNTLLRRAAVRKAAENTLAQLDAAK